MSETLILASGSVIRATLLAQAEVPFTVQVARVDEDMVRSSLQAQDHYRNGCGPRVQAAGSHAL